MDSYKGKIGTQYAITDPNYRQNSLLDGWLLHIPDATPFWYMYVCAVVHLREGENLPPPNLQFKEATHEILVLALDPSKSVINRANMRHVTILTPPNYGLQFTARDDSHALQVCQAFAQALVDEKVLVEPTGVIGARAQAKAFLQALVKGVDYA